MAFYEWCEEEVKRAGLLDSDSDYGGEAGKAILAHCKLFSEEGHSGGSAWLVRSALQKLLDWKPLTPLTSDPSEWTEVATGMWQSRRCPSVFSKDCGQTWYDIDAPSVKGEGDG